MVGGGLILWLAPLACALNSEGTQWSPGSATGSISTGGGAPSTSTGTSAGPGSGAGGMTASTSTGDGVGGAGVGGAGGGATTYEWTAAAPGLPGANCTQTYTYKLPEWLVFKSPTAGRTSQTSESTLCRDYGVDVPRARNVGPIADTTGWGLTVESTRTNALPQSDSLSGTKWAPPTMTGAATNPDPAGGLAATRFISTGNQYSSYPNPMTAGRAISSWAKGVAGAVPFAHFRFRSVGGAPYLDVDSLQWKRYSFIEPADVAGDLVFETRDNPPGAGQIKGATTFDVYAAQVEPGALYPSSYIPTGDDPVTRAVERLSSSMPQMLAPGGWLNVEIRYAPHYSDNEVANEHDVLYFAPDARIFYRSSDRKIHFVVGKKDLTTSALVLEREIQLTILAENDPESGMKLTISGAQSGNGTATDNQKEPIALPASVSILGNTSGAQECADLRYIKFTQLVP